MKRTPLYFAGLVLIGSSIGLPQPTCAQKVNLKPFQGLGEVVAEETSKLLGQRGNIVLVVVDRNRNVPTLNTPVAAFRAALKSQPNIRIQATEVVNLETQGMIGPTALIAPDQFFSILEKHSHADAIISFIGLPTMQEPDWDRLQNPRPKILVAGAFSPQLKNFIERDVVQVAIAPRFRPSGETKKPETPREWFDRFYTVITPANVSELPGFSATPPPRRKSSGTAQ